MSGFEGFLNIIHREIARVLSRQTRRTPCIVSAYDPKTYAIKVKLMPDSGDQPVETGWIPLGTIKSSIMQQSGSTGGTSQTGGGAGATPGSNQGQKPYGWFMPPEIGEQGWLEFHEQDREAAVYHGSGYNDKAPAVQTQPGEWQFVSPWGHSVYMKQDGSLTLTNGNQQQSQSSSSGTGASSSKQPAKQATLVIDNKGNVTITADQNGTVTFKAKSIVHDGNVYLGGADANKALAMHGTQDTEGNAAVSGLSKVAFTK